MPLRDVRAESDLMIWKPPILACFLLKATVDYLLLDAFCPDKMRLRTAKWRYHRNGWVELKNWHNQSSMGAFLQISHMPSSACASASMSVSESTSSQQEQRRAKYRSKTLSLGIIELP